MVFLSTGCLSFRCCLFSIEHRTIGQRCSTGKKTIKLFPAASSPFLKHPWAHLRATLPFKQKINCVKLKFCFKVEQISCLLFNHRTKKIYEELYAYSNFIFENTFENLTSSSTSVFHHYSSLRFFDVSSCVFTVNPDIHLTEELTLKSVHMITWLEKIQEKHSSTIANTVESFPTRLGLLEGVRAFTETQKLH
jgi:hypothetical protein